MEYDVYLDMVNKLVYVLEEDAVLPEDVEENELVSLPSFNHENDFTDSLNTPNHTHALYHHVRELLYHTSAADGSQGAKHADGIYDVDRYKIILIKPVEVIDDGEGGEPDPEPNP